MDPHSKAPKKNTSHGNEVLPQDTTDLIQTPCYQRGSLCQDPAGKWTTRRSPDDRKKTQTAVVWSCSPFISSGQNHLARHSERGKKTRQTKEEVGRQHQGMDGPGAQQVPEGSGEEEKMEKPDCEIKSGGTDSLAVQCSSKWYVVWWLFPRLQGFGEIVQPFTCTFFPFFFFLKWRLVRAHQFYSLCQDQFKVTQ